MHVLGKLLTALTRSGQTFIWSAATLGLLIFFAVVAYDSYLGTLQINDQAAKNIATLIEQDIARNIELYDLSLHGVIDGINDPDVMRQEPSG
jgi:hypothetical protein